MNTDKADKMLDALGKVLEEERAAPVDIVVCGAMALAMQGFIDRPTRDIDGLGLVVGKGASQHLKKPLMSKKFSAAVERVGNLYGEGKFWFSTAATILHDDTELPAGLADRAEIRHYGTRLTVRLCSRVDIIRLKMWAAIKRGEPDIGDLEKMRISTEEAELAAQWCLAQDDTAGPEIAAVLKELGHGDLAERFS